MRFCRGALVGVALLSAVAAAQSSPAQLPAWLFKQPGEMNGWTAGGHLADVAIRDGALQARITGTDPILIGPVFDMPATPTQRIEIRMKASHAGSAQLFWTQTTEGAFGGFSEAKSLHFDIQGDGQWRTYRLDPFWHAAGRIVRLRFDPPGEGQFSLAEIRIIDPADAPRSAERRWDFASGLGGWRAWQDMAEPAMAGGVLELRSTGPAPQLASPLLDVPAAENRFVVVRMAVDRGNQGRIACAASTQFGAAAMGFPLRADGKLHTYNIAMKEVTHWRDRIVWLGIQPTDAAGAVVRIASVEIAPAPGGPAELEIAYFGKTEGVNRAGRPAGVTCMVQNLGGEAAEGVKAVLRPGQGVRVLDAAEKPMAPLALGQPQQVTWQVQADRPGDAVVDVALSGPGAEGLSAQAAIPVTETPPVPADGAIPLPQPVRPVVDVGAFYFPGWPTWEKWKPILNFPLRKPVLGWYDEANPECADWQIKWAVEHGVTFFMVDWYWHKGGRHLEHWVHDAYMKSRFRPYLKWCVMWANHNPPGSHSPEDWRAVTQYWIDNYFAGDDYYRIDGRPAVFIWNPGGIRDDVGGSAEAAKLYALSQEMARKAGLPGIYFVAMHGHESTEKCKMLKAEGYEAFTSYHGFQLAQSRAGTQQFPFADVVATAEEVWADADAHSSGLAYFPIADTGWSSEPWHGGKALRVTGRTPALWGQLCRKARTYAETHGKSIICLGPWNEWGEGSYIEPYNEYGFGDLDAQREALCPPGNWPPNLIPADLGRGPYDLKPE